MTRVRRALIAAGTLGMAYGVFGAMADADAAPLGHLLFLASVASAHDLVLLPVAVAAGVLVGRYLPHYARMPVQVAGFVTATLLVVATPLILGYGRRPDDPSALPLDYGRGLAIMLVLVWATALVLVLMRRTNRHQHHQSQNGQRSTR